MKKLSEKYEKVFDKFGWRFRNGAHEFFLYDFCGGEMKTAYGVYGDAKKPIPEAVAELAENPTICDSIYVAGIPVPDEEAQKAKPRLAELAAALAEASRYGEQNKNRMYAISILTDSAESVPETRMELFFAREDAERFMEETAEKKVEECREVYGKEPAVERANGYAGITVEHEYGGLVEWQETTNIEVKVFDLSGPTPVQIPLPGKTGSAVA